MFICPSSFLLFFCSWWHVCVFNKVSFFLSVNAFLLWAFSYLFLFFPLSVFCGLIILCVLRSVTGVGRHQCQSDIVSALIQCQFSFRDFVPFMLYGFLCDESVAFSLYVIFCMFLFHTKTFLVQHQCSETPSCSPWQAWRPTRWTDLGSAYSIISLPFCSLLPYWSDRYTASWATLG